MKTRCPSRFGTCAGALLAEAVVALAILAAVMLPLAFTFRQENHVCRDAYFKAVAMEVADGEMETLLAGEWRAFQPGRQPYPAKAPAATNLPPGEWMLTLDSPRLRLEWNPTLRHPAIAVVREAMLR